MRKVCRTCKRKRNVDKFAFAGVPSEKKYRRTQCKDCDNALRKERIMKTKQQYIEYKKTCTCSRCGYSDYRALQFHHLRDKKHNVSDMVNSGFSFGAIMEEINKCEVVCANCHQIEHLTESKEQ